MIGQKFNFLTIVSFSHLDKRNRKHYSCLCDCGKRKAIQLSLLKSGNTKSCGCYARKVAQDRKIPNNFAEINQIILGYKRHAKDRKIEFNLSRDDVDKIVRQECHYCGIAAGNLKKTKNCKVGFSHNGIDRIDSSISYCKSNIVACCGQCNIAKGSVNRKEFLQWINKIFYHQEAMADQWSN